ncbi:MAG: CDP-diacylglycerol--serine O-phosphatidyltransferase [Bdellovibrionota bacterium]
MAKERLITKRARLKEKMYKGRFLLPNLLTVGNMFCGFLAICYAYGGNFKKAIFYVFLAVILDGLDGRTARKLDACTKFGFEFDSLSDLVSFGLAPAILCYNWAMVMYYDELGIFISFIYVVCAACRLARFNSSAENLKSFEGLPTTFAAVVMMSLIFAFRKPGVEPSFALSCVVSVVMCYVSFLMVSNYRFISIKLLKLPNHSQMNSIILIAIFLGLLWWYPKVVLLAISAIYCVSGPVISYLDKKKAKKSEASLLNNQVNNQKDS